ncbi:MAG: metallopeptidase TldD-related protein [Geminocystis sp.]|nr:metallopeptidase TldD-related protein [Geminocystis sp.]HIK38790.1 TldD/PmbA family protein [Geminocystis sp. M7585_C2015_104]MCS7147861.1 metallopeptidase TldD-related protein [Geminocystis sp.]MCX8079102.1 metallopeptidase TldD-related protein [Geminocystis sp.]MDW8117051.1 metallopeptidase TldD-related protein [Geminocystis sp.]
MSEHFSWESCFYSLADAIFFQLKNGEILTISFWGERTHFIRFNNSKIRQNGVVIDGNLKLNLIANRRQASVTIPLSGDRDRDKKIAENGLEYLRTEIENAPEDEYIVYPRENPSSKEVYQGNVLGEDDVFEKILKPVEDVDFTGLYAGGNMARGYANSLGQTNWFSTDSFFVDYSLIDENQKAIKGTFSGRNWVTEEYEKQINSKRKQLEKLKLPQREIKPGRYRVYLEPAAVAELLEMFSWGAISEASLQQGGSALARLRQGKTLSPLFNLKENFTRGDVPRFNEFGEISPQELPLIIQGRLVNTLVNGRTALEYNLVSNGANSSESLRAPEIAPGNLTEEEILKSLDTGLYISNLHYLNWSDRQEGKITGMTRYGCFWVEKGEIVATIKNLRFDESLYLFFGENLMALTNFSQFIPNTSTYESRSLGGKIVPGALIEDFTFTL